MEPNQSEGAARSPLPFRVRLPFKPDEFDPDDPFWSLHTFGEAKTYTEALDLGIAYIVNILSPPTEKENPLAPYIAMPIAGWTLIDRAHIQATASNPDFYLRRARVMIPLFEVKDGLYLRGFFERDTEIGQEIRDLCHLYMNDGLCRALGVDVDDESGDDPEDAETADEELAELCEEKLALQPVAGPSGTTHDSDSDSDSSDEDEDEPPYIALPKVAASLDFMKKATEKNAGEAGLELMALGLLQSVFCYLNYKIDDPERRREVFRPWFREWKDELYWRRGSSDKYENDVFEDHVGRITAWTIGTSSLSPGVRDPESEGANDSERADATKKSFQPKSAQPRVAGKGGTMLHPGYGKVEHDEMPQELKDLEDPTRLEPIRQPLKPGDADWNPDDVLMTIAPVYYYDRPNDPDGYTAWMTRAGTKHRWFTQKGGFPKPVPKVKKTKIVVKPTKDGMGLGVFATEDIKRRELILSERPYMIYPRLFGSGMALPISREEFDELSPSLKLQILYKQTERHYDYMVNMSMLDEDKIAFMQLANSHKEDGSPPIVGITRTNGFGITFNDACDKDWGSGYAAVARIGSRFNHSCISDVDFDFDPETVSMSWTAIRDIKAGQQIFCSYVESNKTKAERALALEPYGVECHCRACDNATAQSDQLRKVSNNLIQIWKKQVDKVWLKDPKLSVRVLDPLLRTKKAMEDDGIDTVEAGYPLMFEIMHKVYQRLGMWKEADDCLQRLLAACKGILPDGEYRELAGVMDDPVGRKRPSRTGK